MLPAPNSRSPRSSSSAVSAGDGGGGFADSVSGLAERGTGGAALSAVGPGSLPGCRLATVAVASGRSVAGPVATADAFGSSGAASPKPSGTDATIAGAFLSASALAERAPGAEPSGAAAAVGLAFSGGSEAVAAGFAGGGSARCRSGTAGELEAEGVSGAEIDRAAAAGEVFSTAAPGATGTGPGVAAATALGDEFAAAPVGLCAASTAPSFAVGDTTKNRPVPTRAAVATNAVPRRPFDIKGACERRAAEIAGATQRLSSAPDVSVPIVSYCVFPGRLWDFPSAVGQPSATVLCSGYSCGKTSVPSVSECAPPGSSSWMCEERAGSAARAECRSAASRKATGSGHGTGKTPSVSGSAASATAVTISSRLSAVIAGSASSLV